MFAKHTALAAVLLASSLAVADTRRIAIVVGNNAGSDELPPLRYAESDAGKMARVLVELGEVNADDVLLLQGRRGADIERAIADVKDRVAFYRRAPDVRTVVVFYFSGHSDGEAIELGQERLPYARLKALLQGTGADVRLTIVDACRSGQSIREKGGKAVEGFVIKLADTLQATGDAFITSSAADEAALESSEVMGSYFTHNLISGLRGAADTSGDKLVTLAEAYRYAYDRTVSATSALTVGAQHPSYDYKLSGQGELVLSSLVKPSSLLVLPEGADRSLVTDVARDQVVVEVPAGNVREIALAPGQYALRTFKQGVSYAGRVALVEGGRKVVAWSELTQVTSSVVVAAKGGAAETHQAIAVMEDSAPVTVSVGAGVTGKVLVDPTSPGGLKYQVRLGLEPLQSRLGSFSLFGRPRLGQVRVTGELALTLVGEATFDAARTMPPLGTTTEPVNEAGGHAQLGYRFSFEWWRLTLSAGAAAGGGVLAQLYGARAATAIFVASPHLGLRLRLSTTISLGLDADFPIIGLNVRTNTGEGVAWYGFAVGSANVVVSL